MRFRCRLPTITAYSFFCAMNKTPALKPSGFSLIELLIVTAIIAILGGLLFPAVGYVRNKAKTASCQNNLRQWGIALNLYLDEHRGIFPSCPNGSATPASEPKAWFNVLPPYINIQPMSGTETIAMPGKGLKSMFLCPADAGSGMAASSFDREAASASYYSSYTFNSNIGRGLKGKTLRLTNIKHPDAFVVIAETGDGLKSGVNLATIVGASEDEGYSYNGFRHNHAANFVFADGHAETILQQKVWKAGLSEGDNYGGLYWNPESDQQAN